MAKKIIITGASGFVGRQLVPRLIASGCELLLVGRNTNILQILFPKILNCTYDTLTESGQGFDTLVHLAVLNNNTYSSAYNFKRVNVDLLQETLVASKQAGIQKFINLTTFHALDNKASGYARSKQAALEILEGQKDIKVINVYLPVVYGDDFAGRLAFVKKLPNLLRPIAIIFLSALVPAVHIDKLVNFLIHQLEGSPKDVLLSNEQDKNPVYVYGKRLIDVLFAVTVITLGGWLLLIIWGLVRLGSPGPGIFAQQRIGKNGVPFVCYKFRTMKSGTKQAGTHELTADAITEIGVFLRKTKIDELPQVFNILRGELSLVGPRPGLPIQIELTAARSAYGVFRVLPGISGLAQINGVDMSDTNRLARLDARYIAQRGLLLDLKIILATLLGRGQGDNVRS